MWYYSLSLLNPAEVVYSRPFEMFGAAQWTPSEGANTLNYSLLAEVTANNLTFVTSNTANNIDIYNLQPLRPPPDNTPIYLKINISTKNLSVIANLLQGSTVIKSSGPISSSSQFATYTMTIPFSEWSGNITNWTDLKLSITSSSQEGTPI